MNINFEMNGVRLGAAESDSFKWDFIQPDYLVDKLNGKLIYQGQYSDGSALTEKARLTFKQFWAAIRAEQDRLEERRKAANRATWDEVPFQIDSGKADEWDRIQNEGGRNGYNPYRRD